MCILGAGVWGTKGYDKLNGGKRARKEKGREGKCQKQDKTGK